MPEASAERRRWPRVPVSAAARLERPMAFSVRLLDLGLNGVLIASSKVMDVGQCARLSARLGDVNIDADVQIRRIGSQRDDKGAYRLGASFVGLDADTEREMRRFLSSAHR